MAAHLTNQTSDTTSTPELCEAGSPKTLFVDGTFGEATVLVETASASDGVYTPHLYIRQETRKIFDFDGYLRCRQVGSTGTTSITASTSP